MGFELQYERSYTQSGSIDSVSEATGNTLFSRNVWKFEQQKQPGLQ